MVVSLVDGVASEPMLGKRRRRCCGSAARVRSIFRM
jgi:hypothetical protein